VIQINPRQRDTEPTTLAEIADRRNELSGNLSLYQELAFIEKIDQLLEAGLLQAGGKYKQVVVRVIELSRASLPGARAASKLNRDPQFIQNLIAHGEQQAGTLRRRDEEAGTDLSAQAQAQAQFRDGKITSWRLGPLPPNP
jgi:NTE family protein